MALTKVSRGLLSTSIVDNGNATAITIDSSENVGIGTSSPTGKLDVTVSTDARMYVSDNISEVGSGNFAFQVTNSAGSALKPMGFRAEDIRFATGSTERMRIDGSGNAIFTKSGGAYLQLKDASAVRGAINVTTSDGLVFTTGSSFTERMRIDSSGHVGIGTSSLTSLGTLVVQQSADSKGIALIDSAAVNTFFIENQGDEVKFRLNTTNPFTFTHNTTERMRIDSNGHLLMGTTSEYAFNGGFSVTAGSVPYINVGHSSSVASGNYYAAFRHGTNTIGTITQSGTTGVSYNTSSDKRLKENIADSADAGSKVDAIQIRQFDWKSDGSHHDYGVIAQELVTVAPEAVHQPIDEEDMMGVDYSKLVPMLIKEIQSLRNRVAQLEE